MNGWCCKPSVADTPHINLMTMRCSWTCQTRLDINLIMQHRSWTWHTRHDVSWMWYACKKQSKHEVLTCRKVAVAAVSDLPGQAALWIKVVGSR